MARRAQVGGILQRYVATCLVTDWMWEGRNTKCLSLGDCEDWAITCTLAPFTDSESTGRRTVCVENNGFSLKLSRGDAEKATE